MNIYFCENCGVRISEADLPRGLSPDDERLKRCPKHRAKGSNINVPLAQPDVKIGSNPVLPGARSSATRVKNPKGPGRPADAAAPAPQKTTAKVVAGLAGVGVLVFAASLFSGKEKPVSSPPPVAKAPETVPVRTISSSKAPPTAPVAPVAPVEKLPPATVLAPETPPSHSDPEAAVKTVPPGNPDAKPDSKTAEGRGGSPTMGFMSGDTGDIREELAQAHLEELIAQEKDGKLALRQLHAAYAKFIASNSSTKAGKQAEARLKALPPPPPITVESLNGGLVACWNWEDPGTTVADRSGHDIGGSIAGATHTNDKSIPALSFEGNGRTVVFSKEAFRPITKTFAISCWAKPTAERPTTRESNTGISGNVNQRYAVFATQGGEAYGDGNAGVGISVGTNGISVFEHGHSYLPSVLVYNTAISDWTHIVVTYDNNKPTLYVNGTLAKEGVSGSMNTHPGYSLGGHSYGWYQGLLGEVRIYNRALNAEDVKALFDYGRK